MARRHTARLRLTLWYGGLVFLTGALLVLFTFVTVRRSLADPAELRDAIETRIGRDIIVVDQRQDLPDRRADPSNNGRGFAWAFTNVQRGLIDEALDRLLNWSAVALAGLSVFSFGVGWVMAGRVLRPLSDITATARRLSQDTLHERIGLHGPDDELKELADTFDAMLARLDAAFAAQRQFVANASHELRTPLAIIRTELDVTLADPDVGLEDVQRMAATVRAATERSERLIDSLLLLARADDRLLKREPLDLADVVAGAAADQLGSGLALEHYLRPAEVVGDRALLERLVSNLLDNAVKHNVDGGWIRVATSAAQGDAVLVVANGGARLEQAEAGQLFQRFRRLDRTRSQSRGVGLGLAIVRAVAVAHGGSADLAALPSGGVSVEVRLPLRDGPGSAQGAPPPRQGYP